MIDPEAIARDHRLDPLERLSLSGGVALAGIALILLATRGWAFAADTITAPMPARIDLPQVPGWTRIDYTPRIGWEPRANGAAHRLLGRYSDEQGHKVDVFVALYASQGEGHEAGGFGQGALIPSSPWSWQSAGPALGPAFKDGRSERLLGNGQVERIAVTWYRSGDLMSGSNLKLKLAVIADHLLFRAAPTATLILSAEDTPPGTAAPSITAFAHATGPLASWVDRVTHVR